MSLFKVVLVKPEIPSNTGNIGRTCVSVGACLDLVGPLGFEISDAKLKRAGLDYWPFLKWEQHSDWERWKETHGDFSRTWFFSTKGKTSLYQSSFQKGDVFVFGQETKGLGSSLLNQYKNQSIFIPMQGPVRSLNLANAVAVVLHEAYRQTQASF